MSTDIFANFGALDELIQVVYQGIYRFVALSSVSTDKWSIHLGLSGSQGRWWKGSWTAAEVHQILSPKASDTVLEEFAEKLAELFVGGELFIGNVNPTPNKQITFTLGPASKRPMHISLDEMPSAEAAEFATTLFLDIALQAQSRKCRLHGSSVSYPSLSAPTTSIVSTSLKDSRADLKSGYSSTNIVSSSSKAEPAVAPSSRDVKSSERESKSHHPNVESKSKVQAAEDNVKPAKDGAHEPKKRAPPSEKPAPNARQHKGASLANPNKKARKYQAIEFESDED